MEVNRKPAGQEKLHLKQNVVYQLIETFPRTLTLENINEIWKMNNLLITQTVVSLTTEKPVAT